MMLAIKGVIVHNSVKSCSTVAAYQLNKDRNKGRYVTTIYKRQNVKKNCSILVKGSTIILS